MKLIIPSLIVVLLAQSSIKADDLTAENLTISASAAIAGSAAFGTINNGLTNAATADRAFTITVSQGTQDIQVPYTVEGHSEDGYITVEDYGTISSGYWEAQYVDVIGGYNNFMATYDTEGNELTPAYSEPWYMQQYSGDVWMDNSYWGVTGSHSESAQVWVESYTSTYTDYQFGVPKIQFTATRSDANWVWQVPTASGVKDILLLWDGGLRLPSEDSNRNMALLSDSLTQSYHQPWNGNQERLDSSELRTDELKTFTQVRHTVGASEVTDKSTSRLRSESIQLTREEMVNGTAITVQTQIAAKSASFGGVVEVQGSLRVRPSGDLSMGGFTNGPQP